MKPGGTTLIIPVYNGAQYIEKTMKEMAEFFLLHPIFREVIVVDDGSTDEMPEAIASAQRIYPALPLRVITHPKNLGKGAALKTALKAIQEGSFFVAFTDVELPYGLLPIATAVEYLQHHLDTHLVIGDRTILRLRRQYSWYRLIGTKIFRLFLPAAVRSIHDTQSGMKVFRTRVAKKIFDKVRTDRWVFDIEVLLAAQRSHVRLHELPVTIKPEFVTPRGGVRLVRHGIGILRDLIRIRTYDKRDWYLFGKA